MAKDAAPTTLLNPFNNIALAFSGGGFRAASFSLGTLSYLNSLEINGQSLAARTSFISSASGGTITAMAYAAQRHPKVSFNVFFQNLAEKLSGESILEAVMATLNDDQAWNKPGAGKQRNLINSFAKVYDKILFQGETMEVFSNQKPAGKLEVCFNTTEFYRGLSFRFQTDGTKDQRKLIGNNYLWFDGKQPEIFKKIKLADVLAASSCFPMGFEPIMYPSDFSYADSGDKTLSVQQLSGALHYENYKEEKFPLDHEPLRQQDPKAPNNNAPGDTRYLHEVGFMDGGITDNQGLGSLMLADKKRRSRKNPNPFDLIIVTDVASYFMDSYEPPKLDTKENWKQNSLDHYLVLPEELRRKIYDWQSAAVIVAVFFTIAACLFANLWVRIPSTAIAALAFAAYIGILWGKYSNKGRKIISWLKTLDVKHFLYDNLKLERNFSSGIIDKLVSYLKLTRLSVFEQMIKARISSVMIMVSDVNLKQVRRLTFEKFYNDTCWQDRRVPNFIYELSSHNEQTRRRRFGDKGRLKWTATEQDKQLLLEGLENIHSIAELARVTGTTLWFDDTQTKDETLKKIIACGQFSTCANLLEYVISLERKKVEFPGEHQQKLKAIRTCLEADFIRFKEEPYFMYEQLMNNVN